MSDEPQDGDTLSPEAEAFLRQDPRITYPVGLCRRYPRIANRITELKDDFDGLLAYLDGLEHDMRGGRRGFPFDILMEIQHLREVLIGELPDPDYDDKTKWVS